MICRGMKLSKMFLMVEIFRNSIAMNPKVDLS